MPVGEPWTQAEVEQEERKLGTNTMVKKDGAATGRRANGAARKAQTELKKPSVIR